MPYYLCLHPSPKTTNATILRIDEKEAVRFDARQGPYPVPPGAVAPDFNFPELPGFKFYQMKLMPGQYHPRIARPTVLHLDETPGRSPNLDNELIQTSRGQLVALRDQLERIFRTVQPVEDNYGTYGHDIRNLLILAATEVEAHWKGVLKANGFDGESTRDYVRLLPVLKLNKYAIVLPFYPWLGAVRPFEGWRRDLPTKSLTWYDAYNAVKHDREGHFSRATLLNALQAVCAVAIMNYAQFGLYADNRDARAFFTLNEKPQYDPVEVYPVWEGSESPRLVPVPFE
jgi:hypothetical protein